MKEIPIAGGKCTLVDDEDYERFSKYKWHLSSTGYATRTQWFGRQFRPTHREITMHREICATTPQNPLVDHRNGNILDNRRSNLRPSNKGSNGSNRGATRKNTSGYKGVVKHCGKYSKGWVAQITFQNKNHYLGYFPTPELAAVAYNKAASKLFGEYASLNTL